jgi:GNAT superfamily N-acetyltransferase
MKIQEIRTLGLAELSSVMKWADGEGWNPGIHDSKAFFAADPAGFIGGYIDDQLIGSISAVRYQNDFAFIGLYIMLPEYRQQGISKPLVERALEMTDGIVTGIDGVVAMQPTYSRYGFRIAHRNIRFEGFLTSTKHDNDASIEINSPELLKELDKKIFGTARDKFLESWVTQEDSHTLMIDEGKGKRGFATIRKCQHGHKIGPLFAESSEIALQLLEGIQNRIEGKALISIDVPETNQQAMRIVRSLGMLPTFETARMYRGSWEIPMDKIFGVTSLELG